MKKAAGLCTFFAAVSFAGMASAAPAPVAECRSENLFVPDMHELMQSFTPDTALGLLVLVPSGTAFADELRTAPESSYGALLNGLGASSILFDPDNAKQIMALDDVTMIYVYGCLQDGKDIMTAIDELMARDEIETVAPDVKLYPVPVTPGTVTPAPNHTL